MENYGYIKFKEVYLEGTSATVGKKEIAGPLGKWFDLHEEDEYFGMPTFEQAESEMVRRNLANLFEKEGLQDEGVGVLLGGDLLNQCVGTSFGIKDHTIPFLGLYGACSTMAESLLLASMAVCGGFFDRVVAMTSSHFASSERQYRFPLGYGGQRTPTSQWTVTGSGAALVCSAGTGPRIQCCTVGTVTDLGIRDANNMGSAMAPAAWATIRSHFEDTGTAPEDFDRIVTGDLGQLGKEMLLELAKRDGVGLGGRLIDCGTEVFDLSEQDVHAGGSGCGCSAITLCSKLLDQLNKGKLRKILFCGTGALLSPTSTQQGLPIPGACHAVVISGGEI